jgi:hypothetical protein
VAALVGREVQGEARVIGDATGGAAPAMLTGTSSQAGDPSHG